MDRSATLSTRIRTCFQRCRKRPRESWNEHWPSLIALVLAVPHVTPSS